MSKWLLAIARKTEAGETPLHFWRFPMERTIRDYVKDFLNGETLGHGIETFLMAEEIAAVLTQATEVSHIPIDRGGSRSPRFAAMAAPKLGDKISYSFNGDSYPCGTITLISSSLRRIESSTGRVFWRRKSSGSWILNGVWSMIPGHVSERNPSF